MTAGEVATEVDVKLSSVAEIRQFGDALLRAHAAEAEPDLAEHFDPKWDDYRVAELSGQLIVLAAWNGSDLVGYAVAAVVPSMHYALTLCQHDLLYVAPEWRAKRIGRRLLDRMRQQAKAWGAHRLLMHAKPNSKLWTMLMLLGMKVEETIFAEDL